MDGQPASVFLVATSTISELVLLKWLFVHLLTADAFPENVIWKPTIQFCSIPENDALAYLICSKIVPAGECPAFVLICTCVCVLNSHRQNLTALYRYFHFPHWFSPFSFLHLFVINKK